jgi:hypothetical protein
MLPKTFAVPYRAPATVAVVPQKLATPVSIPAMTAASVPKLVQATAALSTPAQPAVSAAQLQKVSNAAARISSATSRMRAAAGRNKKLRGKLMSLANSLDNKAGAIRMQAASASKSTVMGLLPGMAAVDVNALNAAVAQMIAQGSEADAISAASDINSEMSDDITKLQSLKQAPTVTQLISQATDIGNNAYSIVSGYDPLAGDSTVPTRVAALQTQVNAFHMNYWAVLGDPQYNPATTTTTTDTTTTQTGPGQAGGGGGGGGFDDGGGDDGGSSAVAQFRQGVDPFADEDDGSAPVVPEGGPSADDGSVATQEDVDRAMLEQDSGGDDSEPVQPFASQNDEALLEYDSPEIPDSITGFDWGSEWGQLFYNPAGILVDAMNQPEKAQFQAHVATPTTTASWRKSSASQQQLTAAQQRLAAIKAQRAAQLGLPATAAPGTVSRYTPSGAFVGPTPSDWQAKQPPADQGDTVTPDDTSALSPDSVTGLEPHEVEKVCCGVEALTGVDLTDEMADLVVDSYEHQITDAAPTYERGPAAKHNGAAYLDPKYPRGGSVAGRQGGLIQPEEMIVVGHHKDLLFGGCYEHGLDVLGGGVGVTKLNVLPHSPGKPTVRAGFVEKTTARGRKYTSLQVLNPKHHDHTTSIKNARDAGKRAVSVADKVDKQLKKAAVAVHKTAVQGHLIGASPAVARGVAHHLLTSAQLIKATKSARELGQKALKAADKHQKVLDALNAKNKSGAAAARSKLKMGSSGKATVIHGVDDEAADYLVDSAAYEVIFGDDGADAGASDSGATTNDTGGGTTGGGTSEGPPNYGLGPIPTAKSVEPQEGIDYVADPFPGAQGDINVYSSDPNVPGEQLPVGAVIYDASDPPSYLGIGSYTTFFCVLPGGAQPQGGSASESPCVMPPGGNYDSGGSGYQWHDDGWYSFRKRDYAGPAGSGDLRLKKAEDSGAATGPARAANSEAYNWGPMIGNPNGALRGLRYDIGGNQWFWYYDAAPDWAKAPVRQALINQAILDYQAQLAAAAADYAASQAADKLAADQAKQLSQQQAMEDSQMAHQMEMEGQQAQQEAATQALADEATARQQQAQDESYARQAEAEAAAQAQLERSEAMTQADIEQKAEETAARLEAAQDMQAPPADAGDSAFVPEGETVEGELYDAYGAAKRVLDEE